MNQKIEQKEVWHQTIPEYKCYTDLSPLPRITHDDLVTICTRAAGARLDHRMRLTIGNCGTFAIALRNLMGKGHLIGVASWTPIAHITYQETPDSLLADANGFHDIEHFETYYGEETEAPNPVDDYEKRILDRCNRDMTIATMERICLMLANEEISMEEILQFYDTHRDIDEWADEYIEA